MAPAPLEKRITVAANPVELRALYRQFRPWVFNLLRLWMRDENRIEDIVQETFMQFMRHFHDYESLAEVRRYLYKTARARMLNTLRRREPESIDGAASLAAVPTDSVDGAERSARIRAALGRLAPETRDVVILNIFHDMTFADIAQFLEAPVSTVHGRFTQAMLELKSTLQGIES